MNVRRLDDSQLVGWWTLKRHGFQRNDGTFVPTAEEMAGLLIYSSDRSMSVLITKSHHPKNISDLIVYSGRYSIENEGVYHHIDLSPNPDRMGTKELRIPFLDQDLLTLRTTSSPEGYFEIVWQRVVP